MLSIVGFTPRSPERAKATLHPLVRKEEGSMSALHPGVSWAGAARPGEKYRVAVRPRTWNVLLPLPAAATMIWYYDTTAVSHVHVAPMICHVYVKK